MQNLLANALRHTPPGGIISVAVRVAGAAAGDPVEVVIGDDGSGVEPEHLEHVFDLSTAPIARAVAIAAAPAWG